MAFKIQLLVACAMALFVNAQSYNEECKTWYVSLTDNSKGCDQSCKWTMPLKDTTAFVECLKNKYATSGVCMSTLPSCFGDTRCNSNVALCQDTCDRFARECGAYAVSSTQFINKCYQ
ncbi:uncharacterized protein VTP21DRAFT_11712 [Calcarisporiella thermophila]|uniref:uncharacterized protein n=1 Tax=Calcarisporiella thermophila TaxID=911321 RepID=UPI003742FAF5